MSGHSKWKQIKRQKGASDQKRGKVFSKIIHAITLAAKEGGRDPETNFKLRLAVEKAREANMPQSNIERAIEKATGGGSGPVESILYEVHGPGGLALLVQALTDNRNRTTGEIKNILTKGGGRLGEANSVKWLFEEKGVIRIDPENKNPEEIELAAIDAGAQDVEIDEDKVTVITKKEDCRDINNKLADRYKIVAAEIEMLAKNRTAINEEKTLKQVYNLIENLEEQEDVGAVYSNIE